LYYANRAFPDFWSVFFKFENVLGATLFGETAADFFVGSACIYLGNVPFPSTYTLLFHGSFEGEE
jgi:hypothetical protein